MGTKRDDFWQYVDTSNENKCIFCGHRIPGAPGIKFHLAQVTGEGIGICDKVPDDVKNAAELALNSCKKGVRQSRSIPTDSEENVSSSSLTSLSGGSTGGKQTKGRKRDSFWQYVDTSNGNKCIFCGHGIPGATRIKFHLAQVVGEGISICDKVPVDVKTAAVLALNSSNKRAKQSRIIPTDLDKNDSSCLISQSRGSTRGKVEVDLLPTTDLVGIQFQRHLDKIWEWLMGDDVSIMGVWGMAGVGKTLLLSHIHNKLLNHNHHVIWVTVSQNYNMRGLQRVIANSIVGNTWDEDDEVKTAARLLREFNKMNECVVILDDVWCDISLEYTGIPMTKNGINTIVASRSLDVCKSIGCEQNIELECLSDCEAFTLFSKNLGDGVTLPEDITNIARELSGECRGLALAIVTIARSMRGKEDIREWRDALSKLRSPEEDHNDMKQCVFRKLRSSFDHLNDKKVQDCFLRLPSYFKDKDRIHKEELIGKFVDTGLINQRQGLQAQHDQGHSIVNNLIRNSLLGADIDGDRVCLHKLVRAMAVYTGKECHGYMYETELPEVNMDGTNHEASPTVEPILPPIDSGISNQLGEAAETDWSNVFSTPSPPDLPSLFSN